MLERFDLARRKCTELVDELDWFTVSGDGTRLVLGDGDEVRVLPSERKQDGDDDTSDVVSVDLSRARFLADPAALWRHAYDEAGRLMRRDFWVPDMGGVDWDAVLDQYRPLLDRISGASDFADLLWEVFGELGTSHAYVLPADDAQRRGGHAAQVGLLGADLAPDDGRAVAGEPRAARRVLRPEGAVPAGRAGRRRPARRRTARRGRPVRSTPSPGRDHGWSARRASRSS